MRKILPLFLMIWGFGLTCAYTQTSVVSGSIYSDEAPPKPLPAITVIVKNKAIGAITDDKGAFSLECSPTQDTLIVSSIGYEKQIIPLNGKTELSITLIEEGVQVDEVVITAIGISREKKALGYAVADVKVDEMQTTREANLVNTLSGKVAGLQVSRTTGGAGSSTRIVLRGASSLRDNNQPLIVVDGIPIDNTTRGSGGMWGGVDYGSPISDINPDDIASMTILKGPNAAALYGSRAANGAIVITTKKGTAQKGIGVSLNSTFSVEMPVILRKFQNEYGAGSNGQFDYTPEGMPYFNTSLLAKSWGPKMEGQEYIDWDGEIRTFSPQPNNFRDFFRIGMTATNSVAFQGGSEKAGFRLSYTNLENRDIQPTSSFNRNTLNFMGNAKFHPKLTASLKVNYIRQNGVNRPNSSDGRGVARNFNFMPRNVSTASLEDYKDDAGEEKVWYSVWAWQSNPYWRAHENRNEDIRNRFIGTTQIRYEITDWLSIQGRTGMDFFVERRNSRIATGSYENPTGSYAEQWLKALEQNSDFLLAFNRKFGEDIQLSANFGGNSMTRNYEEISASAGRLAIPYFYDINNSIDNPTVSDYRSKERINSLYGSAQFGYKNYLYLDVTGRNDWSTTLPAGNRSYFYPSVNGSFVFSELMKSESRFFDFGKIRASVASVGSDGDPYMLAQRYTSTGDYNSNPTYTVVPIRPNPDLKPESTFSVETGMDLRFFKNRLKLDLTYYNAVTRNQIIEADVAPSSGYAKAVINAGIIRNQGVEIQLLATPVKARNFTWNTTLNFTKNISKVVELDEGLETYVLGEHWRVFIEARPGNAYGDIVTYTIARDELGNKLVDSTGIYLRDTNLSVVGNFNPKFLMGWQNEFKFKNFFVSFLLDLRYGGEFYAASNMYAMGYSGTVEETLPGREAWYASEAEREAAGLAPDEWTATGGYLAEGVFAPGTTVNDADVSGQNNSVYVNPEDYWGQFSEWGNELPEPHVYDASYLKLREIAIGYQFPLEIAQKMKLGGLSLSLVGRNVWIIWKKVPNIDPESAYSNGNAQGLEYASFPGARSIGMNLNLKF